MFRNSAGFLCAFLLCFGISPVGMVCIGCITGMIAYRLNQLNIAEKKTKLYIHKMISIKQDNTATKHLISIDPTVTENMGQLKRLIIERHCMDIKEEMCFFDNGENIIIPDDCKVSCLANESLKIEIKAIESQTIGGELSVSSVLSLHM